MKLIIAPNKYEGSESLKNRTDDIKYIEDNFKDVEVLNIGNESVLEFLYRNNLCKKIKVMINDPLFRIVEADYGLLEDRKTAIIELGKTSGMDMIEEHEQIPMNTSSYGTGEAIKDALDKGCRKFLITLNRTAAIDGGIGLLGALGIKYTDINNKPVDLTGKSMFDIEDIDVSNLDPRAVESTFTIITKSSTKLSGLMGASYSCGMEKGANKLMMVALDRGLRNYSLIIWNKYGIDIEHKEGAGAGGGIAGSLMTFLNSKFQENIIIFTDDKVTMD